MTWPRVRKSTTVDSRRRSQEMEVPPDIAVALRAAPPEEHPCNLQFPKKLASLRYKTSHIVNVEMAKGPKYHGIRAMVPKSLRFLRYPAQTPEP